jgi:WD40-like Beta Propeller Repeat
MNRALPRAALLAILLPACGSGSVTAAPPPSVSSGAAVGLPSALVPAAPPTGPAVVVIQTGHPVWVDSNAVSPDGRWLATRGGSCRAPGLCPVRLWRVETGAVMGTVDLPAGQLAWSREGRWLKSGGKAYDAHTGAVGDPPAEAHFEAEPGDPQVQSEGDRMQVKRPAGGGPVLLGTVPVLDARLPVLGPIASSKGPKLVAWAVADVAVLLDLATGAWTTLSHPAAKPWRNLQLSPDGRTLLTQRGGEVVLWDVANGKRRSVLTADVTAAPWSVLSEDGALLLLPASARDAALWDVATGTARATISDATSGRFSPDGKRILFTRGTADEGGDVSPADWKVMKMWDVAGARVLWTKEHHEPSLLQPFSPDAALVVGSVTLTRPDAAERHVFDAATGKRVAVVPGCAGSPDTSLAWNPRAAVLASLSACGQLRTWDAETRKVRSQAVSPPGPGPLAWTPDGSELVFPQGRWRVAGEAVTPWPAAPAAPAAGGGVQHPYGFSFAGDGAGLMRWDAAAAEVVETATGRHLFDLGSRGFWVGGSGIILVPPVRNESRNDGTSELVRARDGARLRLVVAFDGGKLQAVALSPEGKFEALVNGEGLVRVRVGADVLQAALVAQGPAVDGLRRPGMLRALLE